MKYQLLKKRALLESTVTGGSIAVMGIIVFSLSTFSDDYAKSGQDLENKVNAIAASTTALSEKYDKVRRNGLLFKKIIQLQTENRLTINQQVAKDRFNYLRDRYYLNDLHLSMSPVAEMQDSAYRRVSNVVTFSDVSLSFDALSDEFVYSLLDAIQQDLPGSGKITSLTLKREEGITNDVLRTISESGTAPVVKGEIKFTWLGIKPVESSDTANAPKTP